MYKSKTSSFGGSPEIIDYKTLEPQQMCVSVSISNLGFNNLLHSLESEILRMPWMQNCLPEQILPPKSTIQHVKFSKIYPLFENNQPRNNNLVNTKFENEGITMVVAN